VERVRVETTTAALTAAEAAAIVLRSPRACRTVLEAWAAEQGITPATWRSPLPPSDCAPHCAPMTSSPATAATKFVALLFGQADRAALEQLAGRLHADWPHRSTSPEPPQPDSQHRHRPGQIRRSSRRRADYACRRRRHVQG